MSKRVKMDGLAGAVMAALNEYRSLAFSVVEDAVEQAARETTRELRSNIGAAGIGGTGKYRRSVSQRKAEEIGTYTISREVYVRPPHYRLAHLLEQGHEVKNRKGGPVLGEARAFPHWEQADAFAENRVAELVEDGLKRRGGK